MIVLVFEDKTPPFSIPRKEPRSSNTSLTFLERAIHLAILIIYRPVAIFFSFANGLKEISAQICGFTYRLIM